MKNKIYKVSATALIIAENEVDAEMIFEKVIKANELDKIDVREASPKDYLPEAFIN
jgi:hypothetical protein